ncbi:DedA family protein [Parafrankia sp. FMc2]|uniref:DedA family protein n=1 Tax=Parafrankia sp. FMc2 TaxID=3233196 RepID=UPI0034D5017D
MSHSVAVSSQLMAQMGGGGDAGGGGTQDVSTLGGFTGWAADLMVSLGSAGVGLITLLETVFPPVPSEVVLPLAGYLVGRDRLPLPGVIIAATAGSLLGALVFYGLAAKLGADSARRVVGRIPLMREEDADRATDWFQRHGRFAVFTGRLVPGVRSLVSLPAGATRMPLLSFCLFTLLGSLLWNSLLIGAGLLLSSRWREVEKYSTVLDAVVIGAVVVMIAAGVVRKVRATHR